MKKMIEKINNEILQKISHLNLKIDDLTKIENAIFSVLQNYNIQPKKEEIVVKNSESAINTLKMFIASKKIEGLSEKTLKVYLRENLLFLSAINKPLEEIITNDVRMYLANKTCGNVTKNNILRNISAFMGWCITEEYIQRNPCARIKAIKTAKHPRKPFNNIEVEKIRNGAENIRDKAIIEVLLNTGCRVSEVAGMNRSAIEKNTISVIGKGNKERTVFLNSKTLYILQKYLKTRSDNNDALFVTLNKPYKRLNASGIEILTRKIGKKVGVEKVHPHRFRHTYATNALQAGIPVEHVQKLLGHEQLDTTMIYAEVNKKETEFLYDKHMNLI